MAGLDVDEALGQIVGEFDEVGAAARIQLAELFKHTGAPAVHV